MIRTALLGLVIAIAGTSASVRAQTLLTAGLVEDCRHEWPDAGYFHCTGFLSGVLQALHSGMVVRRTAAGDTIAVTAADPGPLCKASQIKPELLAKGFVDFVNRHPDSLGKAADQTAAAALMAIDKSPPASVPASTWEACKTKAASAR